MVWLPGIGEKFKPQWVDVPLSSLTVIIAWVSANIALAVYRAHSLLLCLGDGSLRGRFDRYLVCGMAE